MTTIDAKAALSRVMKLLSVSGGSGQEGEIAGTIRGILESAGVPKTAFRDDGANRRSPAGGEVGNLIVTLKGTQKGPRRLLMAHMDTVPLAVGCKPKTSGDWIVPASSKTALGGDDRAGCAVVLTAVCELLRRKLDHPPLTLLFTIQEEIGLRGAKALKASLLRKPELCFNWDGRDPAQLVTGAVGASNLEIQISGIPSHAGVHPELGVNAGVVAAVALADLQKNGWHGLIEKEGRKGASNAGVIRGGDATNVVMPELQLQAEIRSHQSPFRRKVVREWKRAFRDAVKAVQTADGKTGDFTFEEEVRYEAFRLKKTDPSLKAAEAAVRAAGLTPVSGPCDGGLDANWLAEHGHPAVTLGCGQHRIHTVDEQLNIPEYLQACEIGLALATGNC